ncbi:hypothetical protein QR680_004314 [Steinernema hermaphroditum]|uniref:ABC transporter domain-containing protein n=1 Tax=Steinernema hermaphroditum TaxID=289476 RepID=A0AA39LTS7_9BILA|nr:hypothetical protein QR680_004314 [Steinernema hermaphroditum]
MVVLAQLRLLLWKNLLTQLRSPWFTALEFLLPLILIGISFGLMIGYRDKFEVKISGEDFLPWYISGSAYDLVIPIGDFDVGYDIGYTILPLDNFIGISDDDCGFLKVEKKDRESYTIYTEIAYAPSNDHIDGVMKLMEDRYNNEDVFAIIKSFVEGEKAKVQTKVRGFKTEGEMVKYMMDSFQDECNNPLWAGIVFEDEFASDPQSTSIRYKIRLSNTKRRFKAAFSSKGFSPWDTKTLFSRQQWFGLSDDDADGGKPGYWREGFLSLQRGVDMSISSFLGGEFTGLVSDDMLSLQRFSLPPYTLQVIQVGALFLPVIIVFSFMTSIIYIVKNVVMEKEDRLKEYMRVMGLSQWIHWVAYFVVSYIKLLFAVVVLSVLLKIVMSKSDPSVHFVFFALYAFNAVYFAFAVSTFLQSGTAGTMVAVMGWMILWFWMMIFNAMDTFQPFSFGARMANCLNPNIGMFFALNKMSELEIRSDGVSWNKVWKPLSIDDPLTLGHLFIMQMVNGVIFVLVTWYVEAVNPGGEGVPQKPWFFVLPSYWFPNMIQPEPNGVKESSSIDSSAHIEAEPTNLEASIRIVDLSKIYGTSVFKKLFDCKFDSTGEKKAVDRLSLNIFRSQITALLGHNGAGKSTTFSMLTGVTAPSAGTAFINNFDIRNSLPQIRKSLGLCPQYNILFNSLTVMEHLEFFCKLKGRRFCKEEATEMLAKLKLDFKEHAFAGSLSGGQKRKLSLAIALIGGSEVVMLDEPTSGMDPGARHDTWTLLQEEKKNRSILLSTHFMEEADILGDRIAILANGQLQCCGSGMFLKKGYGDGYHLTAVYERAEEDLVLDTLQLLKECSPGAEVGSVDGCEAKFLLPSEDRNTFPEMFRTLERSQEMLGISSFGVSNTTMEEVFLRVNEMANERVVDDADLNVIAEDVNFDDLRVERRLTGGALYLQHANAMFRKRCIYFLRRWTQFIPQLLLPIIILILLVWASSTSPTAKEQPPLLITMDTYDPARVYVSEDEMNLKKSVEELLSAQKLQHSVSIEDFFSISDTVEIENEKQGSMSFGQHNPLAFGLEKTHPLGRVAVNTTRVYFNAYALHSSPLAVNLGDMLIMKKSLRKDLRIQVVNHPLPPTSDDIKKTEKVEGNSANNTQQYAIIVAMAMVVSGFSSFLIRERKKKSKHMQMLTGLRPWMYWGTAFLWDFVCFLIPMFCFLAVYAAFGVENYTDSAATVFTLILVMLLFACTTIPFVYAFSFAFKSAPKGYTMIVMYNIITGMIGTIAVPIVRQVKGADTARTWRIIFLWFFPMYNLSDSFGAIYDNESGRLVCRQLDCANELVRSTVKQCCGEQKDRLYIPSVLDSFGDKGILLGVVFFVVQIFLYWILLIALENDWVKKPKALSLPWSKKVQPVEIGVPKEVEDSDVLKSKEEVRLMRPAEHKIVVKELKKWYGSFNAVKGVSFHVDERNCFGLLGVNGAGKTSTFQMLTGENPVSEGDAFVDGYSIRTEWRQAGAHVGYCPQYDAIIKEMSGEETLFLFARLRGMPEAEIPRIVDAVIRAIGIGIYARRQIKTYSGGNKRRLSLGIALVGMPDVLLLDEPTTGVDPRARRIIWNVLSRVRRHGTAIVLTSHSMEECEALCTSLAIMVYGHFRCFGSVQHLKHRYGSGYTLLVRLKDKKHSQALKEAIREHFPGSVLKEEHLLQLNFELKRRDETSWSSLFAKMERLVDPAGIEDYSLSQTTLEQVFLEFTREAVVE